jgi:hypothetical protein
MPEKFFQRLFQSFQKPAEGSPKARETERPDEPLDPPGEVVSEQAIEDKLKRINFEDVQKRLSGDSVFFATDRRIACVSNFNY